MWQFAMTHEIIFMCIVLLVLLALESIVVTFINRNKPIVQRSCVSEPDEKENEEDLNE